MKRVYVFFENAFDIGSRQLVKIHDLAQPRSLPHYESIRQVNIVEMRWIKEVTENRGQQFFIGAIHSDLNNCAQTLQGCIWFAP
jgi:hypothetical protein